MGWVELILAGLKLILALTGWARDKQMFNAGQDAEIARTSLAILQKTEAGKRIAEKINAMDNGEFDHLVDDLGR